MPKGYTTIEDIEKYAKITIDPADEDEINGYIEAVEEYIDHVTGRDFTANDEEDEASDRTFDGDGTETLSIDPAVEVEEVRFSEEGDPIAVANYYTTPVRKATITGIKLRNGLRFPKGEQNIYIKAKWGFAEVPKDIKLAATVLATGIINDSSANDDAVEAEVQSVSIGRYSVTYRSSSQAADFNRIDDILAYNKRYIF